MCARAVLLELSIIASKDFLGQEIVLFFLGPKNLSFFFGGENLYFQV